MNKFQRKALVLAGNVSLIAFSTIAATVATVAWYGGRTTVTATNMKISCQKAEDSISWNILKYDDDQKAGICYHDEAEFYLPPYDQYILGKNIYSNVLLKVDVSTPTGFTDDRQLYVDVSCVESLLQDSKIAPYTSNICQFKAAVACYTNEDGEVISTNSAIDMTNYDTQYRTVSSFLAGTNSGAVPFVTIHNNTPTKDKDNKITVIPRFYSGEDIIKSFTVFVECSYRPNLVDYYVSDHDGDTFADNTIDLVGDISEIAFRFGQRYSGAYVKVGSQSEITTQDDYMIAYENYEVAFDGSGENVSDYTDNFNYLPVEINRNMIRNSETVNNADFNYSSDLNLHSHSGFNVGGSTSAVAKGMAASKTTNYPNTLTYADGNVRTESNSKYMRYETSQGQTRYNYFQSEAYANAESIQFYKYSDTEAANAVLTNIIISGVYKTEFTIGQAFTHEGMIVTAQYSDGSTSPVQSKSVWTGYNMNAATGQTVTVSYTEDGVTANATYRINVTSGPTVTVSPSILIGLAGDFGVLRARTSFFGEGVTYTWSVNDISVASLSSEHGEMIEVSYLKSGYCTVTCVARDEEGHEDLATVNVRVSGELTDADTYVKVTSNDQLTEGEYLIVYEGNGSTIGPVAFDGSLDTLDAVNDYLSVVIKDDMIAATAEVNAAAFVFDPGDSPGTATFLSKNSIYIGNTTSGNGLTARETVLHNTVSIDSECKAIIKSMDNSVDTTLKFNYASNQMRFRYYKSGQGDVYLYKKTNTNANLRLISIQLRGEFKTDFYTRDRFEIGQGRVYAKYNNNSMRDVTELCSFFGYNMNWAGTQTVTVSLTQLGETKTANYEITVRNPLLTGLSVDTSNATVSFDQNSHFSTNGLVVSASYANGSRADVTSKCDFSGYPQNMDVLGDHTVTVTYTEGGVTLTAEYTIAIVPMRDGYKLVTDPEQLMSGDRVVIAAYESNFAVSKTQNTNNRSQTPIYKSGNYLSFDGASVAEFIITQTPSGTWEFFDPAANGYIYAASSSANQLKTQTTNNANGQWTITATGTGLATMAANGTNTRRNLKYNKSSSLFSCYSSGQFDISLYRYVGEYIEPVVHVTSITPSVSFKEMITGDDFQLGVTVLPNDAADKRVTYLSSASGVATVSEEGLIHAVAPGSAIITITSVDSPEVTATVSITVSDPFIAVTGLVIDSTNQTLDIGDVVQLYAHVLPLDATVQDVSWSIGNSEIASITDTGLVTALSSGVTTVTCYAADDARFYGTITITVTGGEIIAVESLDITGVSSDHIEMTVGDELQLGFEITPDNATDQTVVWESSDNTFATVSPGGLVTAVAATGDETVLIMCTSNDNASAYDIVEITISAGELPPPEPVWSLVTDASTLTDGDQVIIAASGYNRAMGTTQNSNNRNAVDITKDGTSNTLSFTTDVQIFTLKSETGGSWAFNDGTRGYIYFAGGTSSNTLKTQATIDDKARFTVTVTAAGVSTIKSVSNASNSKSRSTIMYNSSNNIFSCYANTMQTTSLYKNTGGTYVQSAARKVRQNNNRNIHDTLSLINSLNAFFTSLLTTGGIFSKRTLTTLNLFEFTTELLNNLKHCDFTGSYYERMEANIWQIKRN